MATTRAAHQAAVAVTSFIGWNNCIRKVGLASVSAAVSSPAAGPARRRAEQKRQTNGEAAHQRGDPEHRLTADRDAGRRP